MVTEIFCLRVMWESVATVSGVSNRNKIWIARPCLSPRGRCLSGLDLLWPEENIITGKIRTCSWKGRIDNIFSIGSIACFCKGSFANIPSCYMRYCMSDVLVPTPCPSPSRMKGFESVGKKFTWRKNKHRVECGGERQGEERYMDLCK